MRVPSINLSGDKPAPIVALEVERHRPADDDVGYLLGGS